MLGREKAAALSDDFSSIIPRGNSSAFVYAENIMAQDVKLFALSPAHDVTFTCGTQSVFV